MSKLIKHEFRATARIMLPLLLASVVSSIVFAAVQKTDNLPDAIMYLLCIVCFTATLAVGVMCLAVMISRFYRNTMADTAYLTMTLPVNSHEFVCAELINDIIWMLIVSAVLLATFLSCLSILDMVSMPDSMRELSGALRLMKVRLSESGISPAGVRIAAAETVLGGLLVFTAFCQRFYAAMAVGQLSSKRRGLIAVLAYIAIGWVLGALLLVVLNASGKSMVMADQLSTVINDY